MSSAQESQTTTLPPRNDYIHNVALAGAILSPLGMLLPPRKADLRLFVLLGTFSLSTNQLAFDYTGQSVYARFGKRVSSVFDTGLPEAAQRTQQLLKEQRERDAARKREDAAAQKKSGVLHDIWMGGEDENWKQRRAEEHRKSFEEGKGMSDIIFDQIADVWSGRWKGNTKDGDNGGKGPDDPSKRDEGKK